MSGFNLADGVWMGPLREPRNISADAKGSIHDDATAQRLGLNGGTVAGSIHMEQFPPLLIHVFGHGWQSRGGLSLRFRTPTTDREAVRCFARPLSPGRAEVWMEKADGIRINEGTASLGPDSNSTLRRLLAGLKPVGALRILAKAQVGAEVAVVPALVTAERLARHLPGVTEKLASYDEGALPPNLAIDALRAVEPGLVPVDGPFVGLYGAIELQMLDGPLFAGRTYMARGRILGFDVSPRTEGVWYESVLSDPETGRDVASMIMQSRLMKDSSPLWASR
jgi:hypothetical protein